MSKLYNLSMYLKAYRDSKTAPFDCVIISGYCRNEDGKTSYCNISTRNIPGKDVNFAIAKHPHVSDCYILKLYMSDIEIINRDEREQSKNKQSKKKKSTSIQPFDDDLDAPF